MPPSRQERLPGGLQAIDHRNGVMALVFAFMPVELFGWLPNEDLWAYICIPLVLLYFVVKAWRLWRFKRFANGITRALRTRDEIASRR
jgi:hypothetical protein